MKKLDLNKTLLFLFLTAVILLSSFDLLQDFGNDTSFWHLFSEACILTLSISIFFSLALRSIKFKKEKLLLEKQLKASQEEAAEWKTKNETTLKNLSLAIKDQFTNWKLTEAEKDVGLFLLKGFSLKEIAQLRNVSERTVRQQSIEIYRKSNLAGRAEFAAFFLDDLI